MSVCLSFLFVSPLFGGISSLKGLKRSKSKNFFPSSPPLSISPFYEFVPLSLSPSIHDSFPPLLLTSPALVLASHLFHSSPSVTSFVKSITELETQAKPYLSICLTYYLALPYHILLSYLPTLPYLT